MPASKSVSNPTITEQVERYLSEHPSIKDSLKNRIINYSRLSRKIMAELSLEKKAHLAAVLIACRRYSEKIGKGAIQENRILSLLKRSELELKNRIIVAVLDKGFFPDHLAKLESQARKQSDPFYIIEGTSSYTIITSEKYLSEIKSTFRTNLKKLTQDLALLTLKSPEDLEGTPGVVSYLYSIFGENNINIVETMSCWTDTLFVISEEDIQKAVRFLKF
jgi:hypothetical protein